MGHYLINTTWRCQLHCSYCLLPHIKINRTSPEHSWSEWVVALRDNTPPGSVLDFAGGDPLLMDGLALMLKALAETGRGWAMTTNALATGAVDELLRVRPGGCVQINVSDHPGNAANAANVDRLRGVYRVAINRVDCEGQGRHRDGEVTSLIPYQSWREGTELDGIRRHCNSGLHHWVADPSGDVFRCNPHMATAQAPMGNLFKRTVQIPDPIVCETGCSTCYTSVPDAWPVLMVPVEGDHAED